MITEQVVLFCPAMKVSEDFLSYLNMKLVSINLQLVFLFQSLFQTEKEGSESTEHKELTCNLYDNIRVMNAG